jgi:hypothetical protein
MSVRGWNALPKDVVDPSVDCVKGLRILGIQGGILCRYIRHIRCDGLNCVPNLIELTRLDIIDRRLQSRTSRKFLSEFPNCLGILFRGF